MPTPEEIRKALRFGSVMAEVHGRNRVGDDPDQLGDFVERDHNVLPLAVERTPAELRVEAEAVLTSLVDTSALNPPAQDLRKGSPIAAGGANAANQLGVRPRRSTTLGRVMTRSRSQTHGRRSQNSSTSGMRASKMCWRLAPSALRAPISWGAALLRSTGCSMGTRWRASRELELGVEHCPLRRAQRAA